MKKSESGQATILIVILMSLLLVGGSLGLGIVQRTLTDRSRAQTAADAAALAGASAGQEAANAAAQGNGATLVSFSLDGQDARVTAKVGSSEAQARARQGRP